MQINSLLDLKTEVSTTLTDLPEENFYPSFASPIRPDAFMMDNETKMELIAKHFAGIMQVMGLDLTDDSLKDTPARVAKMYITEMFSGLDPVNKPNPTLFKNPFQYNQMLVEKNIAVFSNCEHHFVPIVGKAHIAYICNGEVIGLSKLNRVVQYYSKRPQIQERLTIQIARELQEVLNTEDVAVVIDAHHHCVSARGVRDFNSTTITAEYGGRFKDEAVKNEFLKYISL